jgi:membrane fusion protein, copper/silver efflux system
MKRLNGSSLRALLALPAVLLVGGFAYTVARTDGDVAGVGHDEHGEPAAVDPHAGHDMGGIVLGDDGTVSVPADRLAGLGVTLATAERGAVHHSIRTTGHVAWDESRLSTITPKISGYVERLFVNSTGQVVRRGQPVLEIYSPELVAAQEELLAAIRLDARLATSVAPGVAERSGQLAEAARRKLRLWDVSPAQIDAIERSGEVRRTLTLHAASGGFVTERLVEAGQAVAAGMPLVRLADLSTVWVEADVYEQDLRFVRVNDDVHVELAAFPGLSLAGRVSYVYPDVRQETRTARIRVTLPNADGAIKPGMFATVHMEAAHRDDVVLVPRDAVMRTGTRDLVFVETAPGSFAPRVVRVGAESEGYLEVISGVSAGERVVARANFLLDAESRLMESRGGLADTPGHVH